MIVLREIIVGGTKTKPPPIFITYCIGSSLMKEATLLKTSEFADEIIRNL